MAKMARNKAKKAKNNSFFDCGNNLPDYPTLPDDLWQRGDLDGIWDDLPEMDWDFPPVDWDFPEIDWDFPEMDWDFPEIDWDGTVDNNSEKKTQKQRKRPKAGNGGEPPKTGEKTVKNSDETAREHRPPRRR